MIQGGQAEQRATPLTFHGVQALRGLAACMVVVHHAMAFSSPHPSFVWSNGAAGVDIFFVISGFVMAVSSSEKDQPLHPARQFLERRLVRIVPLYWLFTLVLLLRHPKVSVAMPWHYVISSFLFIPARNSAGDIYPILLPGWTLSFEMFFYLLFAGALMLRMGVARSLTPVMLLLATVGLFHKVTWPTITVLLDPLLLEFLAGLWLGYAIRKGVRVNPIVAAVLGSIGLIGISTLPGGSFPGSRVLGWGVCAVLIVQAAVMLEVRLHKWLPRWALLLGDASYSLYLMHGILLGVVARMVTKMHIFTTGAGHGQDEVVMILFALAVSLPSSILCHMWLEKPLNEFLRRRLRLRRVQVQST